MVYLDHAATTPMLPGAVAALTGALTAVGNPSSLHAAGRRARRYVEEAREQIAAALDARPSEVVFTGGGTESDNLAVKGIYWARRDADPRRTIVLVSSVEHHAVLDAAGWLAAREGATVDYLPVDAQGLVTPDAFADALERHGDAVAMATVMWANNEVGTVQPVAELAELATAAGVPFHTDAVQAVGQLPVAFASSGVDALTLTGHKIGGPLGVGALLLGRDVPCVPLMHGGGQEREVRSGTLDTPAIVALAVAVEAVVEAQSEHATHLAALRDDLVNRLQAQVPAAVFNGPPLGSAGRLPGTAHFSFPGCEGDALLMLLDAKGIECSTGSACSAGVAQPSHVLVAMGSGTERARGSLRFSLGRTSSGSDVDALISAIGGVVERARRAGSVRRS